MSGPLPLSRSGGFGLPCAVGAPMPPGPRRAPLSNRAGMNRPVGSVVTVSDVGGPVPHSRRSRGALDVRRPATDAPFVGVPPKDLAAPVPTGAALSRAISTRAPASAAKLSAVALLPVYLRLPLTSRI